MSNNNMNNNGYSGANAPIVIFFGQSTGGKTTALVRLVRYLQQEKRCSFELSEAFHNRYYGHLQDISFEKVKEEVETQINISSYSDILGTKERALMNIRQKNEMDKEECVCRFLEVPGEDFVNLHNAGKIGVGVKKGNYDYLEDVMTCSYKKVWVFFFDADFKTSTELQKSTSDYIDAMQGIKIGNNDKIIALINKVDKIQLEDIHRPLREDEYVEFINNHFKKVLNEKPFSTKRWDLFGLRSPYKTHYELLAYSSYHLKEQRRIQEEVQWVPEESGPEYPEKLWETIDRAIKNRY